MPFINKVPPLKDRWHICNPPYPDGLYMGEGTTWQCPTCGGIQMMEFAGYTGTSAGEIPAYHWIHIESKNIGGV